MKFFRSRHGVEDSDGQEKLSANAVRGHARAMQSATRATDVRARGVMAEAARTEVIIDFKGSKTLRLVGVVQDNAALVRRAMNCEEQWPRANWIGAICLPTLRTLKNRVVVHGTHAPTV